MRNSFLSHMSMYMLHVTMQIFLPKLFVVIFILLLYCNLQNYSWKFQEIILFNTIHITGAPTSLYLGPPPSLSHTHVKDRQDSESLSILRSYNWQITELRQPSKSSELVVHYFPQQAVVSLEEYLFWLAKNISGNHPNNCH